MLGCAADGARPIEQSAEPDTPGESSTSDATNQQPDGQESAFEVASADAGEQVLRCANDEVAYTLSWVQVDWGCGAGFEESELGPCRDTPVEVDSCIPSACLATTNECAREVLAIVAADLPRDTPSMETFCFPSREGACACLECCDGTERTFTSTAGTTWLECYLRPK